MNRLLDLSSDVVRTAKRLGERVYHTGPVVGYTAGDSSLSYILLEFVT